MAGQTGAGAVPVTGTDLLFDGGAIPLQPWPVPE